MISGPHSYDAAPFELWFSIFKRVNINPERSKQAKGKYIFKSRRQYLQDEFKVLILFGLAAYQGLNLIIVSHDFILAASY